MKALFLLACEILLAAATAFSQSAKQRPIESIEGPTLYKSYCATCHGKDAKGNGPMLEILRVPPPDLTRFATRRGGQFSRAEMRRIIRGPGNSGTSKSNVAHGTREMPVWGPIFSEVGDGDRDMGLVRVENLVLYLESLQTK